MMRSKGEVEVLRGEAVVHAHPIGAHAILIGRGRGNDLQLADGRVSGHHLVLRWSGPRLIAFDLGSRNGTFLNDAPIDEPVALKDGDRLRLGSAVELRVRLGPPEEVAVDAPVRLSVADLDSGVIHPFRGGRLRVGARPGSDLLLPEGPGVAATIMTYENGEIWLGTDEEERLVTPGELLEIAGRRLLLRDEPVDALDTGPDLGRPTPRYAYQLIVRLAGPQGPEVQVDDPAQRLQHVVRAENRVTLLQVLARRAVEDRERGLRGADRGWVTDEEAIDRVWGARAEAMGPNNYQVLLCRLRKEISDAGLDGWFIQKRTGFTRVALDDIQILDG